jgi:ketosteroid isomerase-like protein
MSQENVEAVRRDYEAVTARLESLRELFAPDYALDVREVSPEFVEAIRGFEAAEEALREYWVTFENFRVELEEVIHADEEQVVTAVRDGGQLRGSDVEVWNRFFHVWTFRDGKVVRLSIHTDRNRALEAAGLRE